MIVEGLLETDVTALSTFVRDVRYPEADVSPDLVEYINGAATSSNDSLAWTVVVTICNPIAFCTLCATIGRWVLRLAPTYGTRTSVVMPGSPVRRADVGLIGRSYLSKGGPSFSIGPKAFRAGYRAGASKPNILKDDKTSKLDYLLKALSEVS